MEIFEWGLLYRSGCKRSNLSLKGSYSKNFFKNWKKKKTSLPFPRKQVYIVDLT